MIYGISGYQPKDTQPLKKGVGLSVYWKQIGKYRRAGEKCELKVRQSGSQVGQGN